MDAPTSLEKEFILLHLIGNLCHDAVERVIAFVGDANLCALTREYEACLRKRNVDIGFNLFAIVSDLYYRENFHSDILRVLIDPKGKHQEQENYLRLFLEFVRSQGIAINVPDYANAKVVREEGRVDLLIKDEDSGRAIIIENKINNACDMPRQLPRYLEYVRAMGYTCDGILYLRLNGHADPDTTGWTPDERKEVKALLKIVCAYDETANDLLNGWISRCEEISENPDAKHILRQYGALLKKLGGNVMNKPIMEKFYKIVIEGENLKTALSLKAMLEDLVLYRVEKIIDKFKSDLAPFHKISNYNDNDAYFTNLFWDEAHFGIDVVVTPECYSFRFWDRKDREGTKGLAKSILQKMNCLDEYVYSEGGFGKIFGFPAQEQSLYEHITAFKSRLIDVVATSAR